MTESTDACEGRCTCGGVRYRIAARPLVVHCCHCRWCQRETGTSYALNALIETDHLTVQEGTPEKVVLPSDSGKGQAVLRCPDCKVALWSHYGGGDRLAFVRVGTLDAPDAYPPDVHIYTESKQPWVEIPDNVPAYPQYYRGSDVWSAESLERRKRLFS